MGETVEKCPVCHKSPVNANPIANVAAIEVSCRNCGRYQTLKAIENSPICNVKADSREAAILSHAIRRRTDRGEQTTLEREWVSNVLESESIPPPTVQADNIIQWLGDEHHRIGFNEKSEITHWSHQAIAGSQYPDDILYALKESVKTGLVDTPGSTHKYGLTFKGWRAYEEIIHHATESKRAFMAMGYGDKDVNEVFEHCFKKAVRETGFTLWRLDKDPKAGVIDARMEVAIRTSRFVVADITYGNLGAYWEAGFAEGMGKPVIYTCESKKKRDIHFDVSHRQYVEWGDDYDAAAKRLKACIRATLPVEARMEDEGE